MSLSNSSSSHSEAAKGPGSVFELTLGAKIGASYLPAPSSQ